MSICKWMMLMMLAAGVVSAEGKSEQVDMATQYRQKAAQMTQLAETAATAEVRSAYSALSRNYARMAEIKDDASARAARGQAMDWAEYHRIEGLNKEHEAVIAQQRARLRGEAGGRKPAAPAVPAPRPEGELKDF